MTARRSAALLAALVLLGGCRYGDIRLQDADVDPVPARAVSGGARCTLPAFDLRDARPSPVLISLNGQQLIYDNLVGWTRGALQTAATTDASRRIEIELARAYLEPHGMGHGFQFVLRVRDAANPRWRVYRGADSGTTWWATNGEFGQYLEDAGRQAIRALVAAEADCAA